MDAVPRLQVEDVTVRFGGATALESVSFDVPAGQVVGLIGANGAGKTTLFNVISGSIAAERGHVQFDGKRLRAKPHQLAGLGIARTLQGERLDGERTVLEHVMSGAVERPRTGLAELLSLRARTETDERQLRDRVVQLLREFDLASSVDAYPAALPYAVTQRVALARALVTNPRLLLLDEPAGGLDQAGVGELGQVIRALVSRPGRDCAVLIIEHHVEMVLAISDAVVVLDAGQVIARGTPDEVRQDAAAVATYFEAD